METLRLLRMEHRIGKQIRMNLIGVCAQLDVFCLPALVAFSLGSFLITQSSSAKHDEEEALFHQMLRGLARNLNIEKICKKTRKSDTIVSEVYEHFFRFLQLDRKSWKFITSWISRNKSDGAARVKEEENGSRVDQEEEESTPANSVTTFETLLIISLLSSSESCPPTFVTAVNSRIMALSTTNASKFLKQIDLAISLKKFSSGRLSSLIHVAKYCLWAPDENIRRMGVSVWKQLLVGMERKNRVVGFFLKWIWLLVGT
uniref:Uncharacterized protein n=1 Tax=Caenorhabditis japonica TaxID=281687 RepID=A0A8R1IIV1_CAEJA